MIRNLLQEIGGMNRENITQLIRVANRGKLGNSETKELLELLRELRAINGTRSAADLTAAIQKLYGGSNAQNMQLSLDLANVNGLNEAKKALLLPRLQVIEAEMNDTTRRHLLQALITELKSEPDKLDILGRLLASVDVDDLNKVKEWLLQQGLQMIKDMTLEDERYDALEKLLNCLGNFGNVSVILRPLPLLTVHKVFNTTVWDSLQPRLSEIENQFRNDRPRALQVLQALVGHLGGVPTPASGWLLLGSADNGLTETVKELLGCGVDVLAPNALGCTSLNLATRKGRADVIEVILQYMASKGASDEDPDNIDMRDIWRARLGAGSRELVIFFIISVSGKLIADCPREATG
jgi:hypothetical protein